MVKFRYVILDDFDNVIELLYESGEYPNISSCQNDIYQMLLKLDDRFNFTDYDNCPLVIVQVFENSNWRYYSDAVVDWYNL